MKMAKFLVSHFDAGVEKFKAGKAYPLDDETRLCIVRGAAEEADVADEPAAEKAAVEGETNPAAGDAKADETQTYAADAKPAVKAKK